MFQNKQSNTTSSWPTSLSTRAPDKPSISLPHINDVLASPTSDDTLARVVVHAHCLTVGASDDCEEPDEIYYDDHDACAGYYTEHDKYADDNYDAYADASSDEYGGDPDEYHDDDPPSTTNQCIAASAGVFAEVAHVLDEPASVLDETHPAQTYIAQRIAQLEQPVEPHNNVIVADAPCVTPTIGTATVSLSCAGTAQNERGERQPAEPQDGQDEHEKHTTDTTNCSPAEQPTVRQRNNNTKCNDMFHQLNACVVVRSRVPATDTPPPCVDRLASAWKVRNKLCEKMKDSTTRTLELKSRPAVPDSPQS